jgi:hypothetical protein
LTVVLIRVMGTSLTMPRYSKSLSTLNGMLRTAPAWWPWRCAPAAACGRQGGLGDLVGADGAAGAGGVVDHDGGTTQRLAQRFGQVARHRSVGPPAAKGTTMVTVLSGDREVGSLGAQWPPGGDGGMAQGKQG